MPLGATLDGHGEWIGIAAGGNGKDVDARQNSVWPAAHRLARNQRHMVQPDGRTAPAAPRRAGRAQGIDGVQRLGVGLDDVSGSKMRPFTTTKTP